MIDKKLGVLFLPNLYQFIFEGISTNRTNYSPIGITILLFTLISEQTFLIKDACEMTQNKGSAIYNPCIPPPPSRSIPRDGWTTTVENYQRSMQRQNPTMDRGSNRNIRHYHMYNCLPSLIPIYGASFVTSHPWPRPLLPPITISATIFPVPGPRLIPHTACPAATNTPARPFLGDICHPIAGNPR